MSPTVQKIEIGLANGQPAVTLHLDNDTSQTIVFTPDSAKKMCWNLINLCERFTSATAPSDITAVGDSCSVSLSPPKEE